MVFVITIDPATQLVPLQLEGAAPAPIICPVTAVLREVGTLTATVEAICFDQEVVVPFNILTFALTGGSVFESGATVATPGFTASYDAVPDVASLTDNDGTPAKDVLATPNAFSSDGTFMKTANNASVIFQLNAGLLVESDVATTSISWRPLTFWGLGGAALLTEAQIEALANSQLDNNFGTTFSPNAPGASDYVWYCFPQSYDPGDAAQFQVGPFVGGWAKIGVVSVTNGNGVTQDYACWRTDFAQLGSFTVTVF